MTLDTKALEAAVLDFCKHLCTPLEVKEIWANKHRKQIYLNATESVLLTYNATRSEPLPDELKAIAERNAWMLTYERDKLSLRERDLSDLLRMVNDYEEWAADVRRLTREIDVELNGDDAAKQASLCDLVGEVTRVKADIRRDTAREIVKAIEKDAEADLSAAEQCQGPEVSRRMYAVSRRLRGLAASIRTAYGVEG